MKHKPFITPEMEKAIRAIVRDEISKAEFDADIKRLVAKQKGWRRYFQWL